MPLPPLQACPLRPKWPWGKQLYDEDAIALLGFSDYLYGSTASFKVMRDRSRGSKGCTTSPSRRPWNAGEDARLQQLITCYGLGQWSHISALMAGRSNKQCRERWQNHLNPAIRREPWTPEEDAVIVQLQADQGNRWSDIAQRLPGRTAHGVRSRWHFHLKPTQTRRSRPRTGPQIYTIPAHGPRREKGGSEGEGVSPLMDPICEAVLADADLADAIIQSLEADDDDEQDG